MIFTQFRLIAGAVSIAAILGAGTWIYFQGKEEAREECLKEQAKVMKLWEEKVTEAETANRELAKDLAATINQLEKAKNARTKRIIKYVEKDPDSSTVIFDDAGLQILNDAQKGIDPSN